MVRYVNAEVEIYAETVTINDEGETISKYEKVATLKGDVQPARLSESEAKMYGLSEKTASVKKFFYDGFSEYIKKGNRASVTSTLENGTTTVYEIEPVNAWPKHGECLLVKIENE